MINTFIFVGLMLNVSNAYSNLILNGDFEEQSVTPGGWKWFEAKHVSGWHGSNIEIWNNLSGFKAAHGAQHMELNAHGPNQGAFSIYQSFNTEPGKIYDLSFFFSARSNTNEQFKVEIISSNSIILESFYITDQLVRIWQEFQTNFQASTKSTKLQFTSILPSGGTVGNLLDNINVQRQAAQAQTALTQTIQISEPQNWSLITLGILGLLFIRTKRT